MRGLRESDGAKKVRGSNFAFRYWWLAEPAGVPRVARGIPNRVERLKCLGNAVVPAQFYPIFRAIAEVERCRKG